MVLSVFQRRNKLSTLVRRRLKVFRRNNTVRLLVDNSNSGGEASQSSGNRNSRTVRDAMRIEGNKDW